jgi:putative Mg2+ transporter-C (MgtC) family protein
MITSDFLQPLPLLDMVQRLSLAALLGGIIGWERQTDHKPAGLRTHMLVCLGATLFVMTSLQIGTVAGQANNISRVIQGIVTGIGFLGAGEIVGKQDNGTVKVRGLTSAAAIWVSAALGVAIAVGLWQMALFSLALTIAILRTLKRVEARLSRAGDRRDL